MKSNLFTRQDIEQIHEAGLSESQIQDQIEIFKKGTPYVNLVRPCIVGDGIKRLTPALLEKNIAIYENQAIHRKLTKFVPASGAATRMVKILIKANNRFDQIRKSDVESGIFADAKENHELLTFINNIKRLACYPDLASLMKNKGLDPDEGMRTGDYKNFINFLVTDKGLNYDNLPKGLIQFHAYPEGSRTAFEEHLVEAAGYGAARDHTCELHFTVAEAHEDKFIKLYQSVKSRYESRYKATFHVSFSFQKKDTNTIAVDMNNQPFRRKNGRLLFRPGGHGALIDNLNRLHGDIVFIKNIDNVAQDRFKVEMFAWKKALCGHLVDLQQQIFSFLKQLHDAPNASLIKATATFIEKELYQSLPENFAANDINQQKKDLIQCLDRPLRVCGMVPNEGEPGGGPFWIAENNGRISSQIVETSQIDSNDENQKTILNALTHFNPVDIVCGVRNWKGESFDLSRFVDSGAVFISRKSEDGRDLKALEHPGLWNGAMADWNTVFVEVPLITFNPVKQITDLLREPHLPARGGL